MLMMGRLWCLDGLAIRERLDDFVSNSTVARSCTGQRILRIGSVLLVQIRTNGAKRRDGGGLDLESNLGVIVTSRVPRHVGDIAKGSTLGRAAKAHGGGGNHAGKTPGGLVTLVQTRCRVILGGSGSKTLLQNAEAMLLVLRKPSSLQRGKPDEETRAGKGNGKNKAE